MRYERKCQTCLAVFDVFASVVRRDEPVACPDCGSGETRRIEIPKGSGVVFNTEGGYQMAVFDKKDPHRTVEGHFGKDARAGGPRGSKWR